MAKYKIMSSKSGANLGTYEAATPAEAMDAMARDAGYENLAHAAEVTGNPDAHLYAELAEGGANFDNGAGGCNSQPRNDF